MQRIARHSLGIALLLSAAACSSDGGGGDATPDGSTDTDPDGSADADTDTDTDADTDADADADTDADADLTDYEPDPPWFPCPTAEPPEEATRVVVFDQEPQYFNPEDRRTVEATATLPAAGGFERVLLLVRLECPESGLCDHWDRAGSLHLVESPGTEEEVRTELARFVTPYRVEMCQMIDVTPLAARLAGERTFTSFIDTWVGPGHEQGEGWRTTVELLYLPGEPEETSSVIDVWPMRNITVGETDTDSTVDAQIDPVLVEIPATATRVEAHLTTTGHSFGNTGNCAEFCQMRQDLYVNGERHSVNPWRDDCEHNWVSPQYGTWEYDRNGWCPGAIAVGHALDITEDVVLGAENEIDFDIRLANGEEYVNLAPVDLLPYELVSLKLYVYE